MNKWNNFMIKKLDNYISIQRLVDNRNIEINKIKMLESIFMNIKNISNKNKR